MGRKKTIKGKRSNNEGSIYQMPNGRWRCMLSIGLKEDGTTQRVSKYFDTEAEAKVWRTKQLATVQEYGKESVKEIVGLFVPNFHKWLLEVKKDEVMSVHFKVLMGYYSDHIKPYFLKYKQKDITKDDFQKYFNYLEQKNIGYETRRKMKCTLHQYFERELANSPMRNPLDGIKLNKKKKELILSPEAVFFQDDYKAVPKEVRSQFLEALDKEKQLPFLKPLCYVMYFSGNRIGETLAYQWKDFNFENRYMVVYKAISIEYEFDENGKQIGKGKTYLKQPKTEKGVRPLPILDVLYEALMEWREYRILQEKVTGKSFTAPDDYVFATNQGKLRSRGGTTTLLKRFLERHGLKDKGIHFHALRQTFSNSLFSEESDEKTITDILGHTKISTSQEHYHSIDKFDSVQKTARMFNAKFKPKDSKYCAEENTTFAPEGFIPEQASIDATKIVAAETPPKRPISEILEELASYPEFTELLKRMSQAKAER